METGEIYHIFNKSIAGYKIFNSGEDYSRMIKGIRFFSLAGNQPKFSQFINYKKVEKTGFEEAIENIEEGKAINIISYCLMPTHFHFIVKEKNKKGIVKFVSNLCNSYTRYFNNKYNRRGPLWQGRFKRVKVESDEQLIHLTRYIHLNPVTAGLVEEPGKWDCSSYNEYVKPMEVNYPICKYKNVLEIDPKEYKDFVISRADYQQELAKIKNKILE